MQAVIGGLLDSSVTWGVLGIALAAVALSGRLSVDGAYILLIVAWITGCCGLYRSEAIRDFRLFIAVSLFMGGGLALVSYWIKPEPFHGVGGQGSRAAVSQQLNATPQPPSANQQPSDRTRESDKNWLRLEQERLALNYVPSMDVLYDPNGPAVNLFNRGRTNLYLWGNKVADWPKSLEQQPVLITPGGSYHIWAKELEAQLRIKLGENGEGRIPVDFYISTDDHKRHVLRYTFWTKTTNGELRVETQNLGEIDSRF